MPLLDPSSDAYRVVAGIIESAHRRVGASESHRWNGQIGLLSGLGRSRSDVDGTIHLHHRAVIDALTRTQAPWWNAHAARDAAYYVVHEALRQASDSESSRRGTPLDVALPRGARSLDHALAQQRTYEVIEAVLADNGMAHVYSTEVPGAIRGGPLASRDNAFGPTTRSAAATGAARGLVDGLESAGKQSRNDVFDALLNHPKSQRWGLALALVAEQHGPALKAKLAAEPHLVTQVSKRADIEWGRLETSSPKPGFAGAPDFGYAIGFDTVKMVARSASYLAGQPAREAARELTPGEVLGAQVQFTSVTRPPSAPGVSTPPGQSQNSARERPQNDK